MPRRQNMTPHRSNHPAATARGDARPPGGTLSPTSFYFYEPIPYLFPRPVAHSPHGPWGHGPSRNTLTRRKASEPDALHIPSPGRHAARVPRRQNMTPHRSNHPAATARGDARPPGGTLSPTSFYFYEPIPYLFPRPVAHSPRSLSARPVGTRALPKYAQSPCGLFNR